MRECGAEAVAYQESQHEAKGLFKYLSKYKIPLVSSKYKTVGRLKQGVFKLVLKVSSENAKAPKQAAADIIFIGVEESIFNQLWNEAGTGIPPISPLHNNKPADGERDISDEADYSEILLGLLEPEDIPASLSEEYIGESTRAKLVRHLIIIAARSNVRVLILGDTGTGKEVVARSIHKYSFTVKKLIRPFRAINCAGIPEDMLESELFGTVKGSGTDLIDRPA